MHLANLFSIPARTLIGLWAGIVFWGHTVCAQEKSIDTLHRFNPKVDTVWLGFDDVLQLSVLYDSADKDDWHYIYRWNTGERTDAVQVKFEGKRKVLYIGQRFSARHWPGAYDTVELGVNSSDLEDDLGIPRYVSDPKDDTVILCAPDMEGTNIKYAWTHNYFVHDDENPLPDTAKYAVVYRNMWPEDEYSDRSGGIFWCRTSAVSDKGVSTVLLSSIVLGFEKKPNGSIQPPAGEWRHNYYIYSIPQWTQIYARLRDTLHLFSYLSPDHYPDYCWSVFPGRSGDFLYDSVINIYFKDNIYVNFIHYFAGMLWDGYVYWGIKPNAEIESDSVWVFFPQYPYSNLGGRVDLCLPPDAPLPAAEDTIQVFNLGPWNRELDYVEYAWLDGTKDAMGRDSIVGTDSAFAYLFGRMDSVSPELYVGMLVTRVAADSLWQDSCGCFVPCTDDACHRYDTVRIYLHRFPSRKQNLFLSQDTMLCAHKDLTLLLPPAADNYRCFWLDQDSVLLPYGFDTNQFTITGMRGTDGFGANTDTRNPRFFQLRLDYKLCGISLFDTLLVYDQVKPDFELPCHDALICLNEPLELDITPFVYRPFYNFEWSDGETGSDRSFTDSGTYILNFFVNEDFAVCGYAAASDTVRVRWSNPALTLINLPSDTSFCEKLSVVLDASVPFPATRYSWQEGNLDDLFSPLEDSTLFTDPVIKVDKDVSLALFVVDTMGCVNTKQIDVSEDDCKPSLSVPNVFTPNGDGVNDVLKFRQIDQCYDVDVLIVDRKGTHVLHEKLKNPDDFAWNGCLRNGSRKLPDGAYFYFISYRNAYGKKKYQSGSITILGSTE